MNGEREKSVLAQSILSTLALFAAQEQAVTLLELHKFLLRTESGQKAPSLLELEVFIDRQLKGRAVKQAGLYALAGFERSIQAREEKYLPTAKLFKKAARFASHLRYLPYLRAAAISGSCAQMNARPNSDIDLFIIVSPGHVYTARFLVSAYFQVLGMRRHGKKIAGRFCLNHYVVEKTALTEDHTAYTAMLYTSFFALFGLSRIREFWQANLRWIKEFFLSPQLPQPHAFEQARANESWLARALEALLSPISGLLESFLGRLQRQRIQKSRFVIASDQELAFHPGSRGQQIMARYEGILAKRVNPVLAEGGMDVAKTTA